MHLKCRTCNKPKPRGHIKDVSTNQMAPSYGFFCLDCCPVFPPESPTPTDFMDRIREIWWERFMGSGHFDDILDEMDQHMLTTVWGILTPDKADTPESDAPDPSITE